MRKRAVVAWDHYTSEMDYWIRVEKFVDNNPSTLRLMLPEAYLGSDDSEKIVEINKNMNMYLENEIFDTLDDCVILMERTTQSGKRRGLVGLIDLEDYDYKAGSGSLVRATEKTVEDRLPPRIKVRKDASLELPHILVLIDDIDKTVIEPLFEKVTDENIVYDFELMEKGGRLKGYKISDRSIISEMQKNITKLADKKKFIDKYDADKDSPVLLFAVGDGNHSLATAKACWEEIKAKTGDMNHLARYALVELNNIHDEAIKFEPIHRVVFHVGKEKFLSDLDMYMKSKDLNYSLEETNNYENCFSDDNFHTLPILFKDTIYKLTVTNPNHNIEAGTVQKFLNEMKYDVDYIHGEDVVLELTKKGNIGIILPVMEKSDLFKTVIKNGSLPRKTFSMGHANEKRFYLEARKIKK